MQRSESSPENQSEYETVAGDLLSTISHRVLRALLQNINLVTHLITRKLSTTQLMRRLNSVATLSRGRPAICVARCNSVHAAGYSQGPVNRGTKPSQQGYNSHPAGGARRSI